MDLRRNPLMHRCIYRSRCYRSQSYTPIQHCASHSEYRVALNAPTRCPTPSAALRNARWYRRGLVCGEPDPTLRPGGILLVPEVAGLAVDQESDCDAIPHGVDRTIFGHLGRPVVTAKLKTLGLAVGTANALMRLAHPVQGLHPLNDVVTLAKRHAPSLTFRSSRPGFSFAVLQCKTASLQNTVGLTQTLGKARQSKAIHF